MEWHSLAPELWAELILAKRRGGQGGGEERGFLEKGTTGGNHVGET